MKILAIAVALATTLAPASAAETAVMRGAAGLPHPPSAGQNAGLLAAPNPAVPPGPRVTVGQAPRPVQAPPLSRNEPMNMWKPMGIPHAH